ncbi:dihydropteroate synthase [Sphingomonas sp. ASV193]|uniref:dihydropteroate synthase n=1 Tax=Sphingomonas sp. ASV193 TaxID=3144405 RepID=UPI0032E8FC68
MRTLIRPTGFVDSPFGHDGQVARLAGGLCWFACVELIHPDGRRELVPVEGLESRFDEGMAADWARLTAPRAPLVLGSRTVRLDQPQLMGILNVTPDSFSDGGAHASPQAAAEAGFAMAQQGAAIVDVGGESTRPKAKPVWEQDEIARVQPVIEQLAAGGTAVSIDTRKAAVMEAALAAGATMVNDVSALTWDDRALAVAAASTAPVVLMHAQGDPQTMQDAPSYKDVLVEVFHWLEARVAACEAAGIDRARILVDPGIGFGKSVAHNLALLNGLSLFHGLGCGIVLGASRKRFIGALSNEAPADRRLPGSLAVAVKAADQGVQLIRVHDVADTLQALKLWRGLRDQALTPRI